MFKKVAALLHDPRTQFRKELLDKLYIELGHYEGTNQVSYLEASMEVLYQLIAKEITYAQRTPQASTD